MNIEVWNWGISKVISQRPQSSILYHIIFCRDPVWPISQLAKNNKIHNLPNLSFSQTQQKKQKFKSNIKPKTDLNLEDVP
jgi:hypothetical protein